MLSSIVLSTTAARADAPKESAGGAAPDRAEVVVRAGKSIPQMHRESAEAVSVYDLTRARRQGADLGEVAARLPGVSVVRFEGLGADPRVSLDGFANDQVRLFVDGVPLEAAGFAFGLAAVPLAFVERVEVYRGVVPLRFGADALGGANGSVASTMGWAKKPRRAAATASTTRAR